ncbi:DUF294 nucleotidyltransferase-like domain-containing protein [Flavobacteriaceae bacterium F89]|uniref:DUF294 nucleotidyltransferase-like domain-containing protein n=1 Tax=Cerina litoralis TaxID=2874477 RepID=A0AAE3EUT8_9FLAO|nr:DUF294 nucleotidyltransferase-like domain-containing protein [Cerina litoralis]MCG2460056.1 DUF294 nucleotidyltransferase-like domain-containing protein [Cerina litoralis]
MKNTISQRVADFLRKYPPFNELKNKDLELLSEQITIIYREKGSPIFLENENPHPDFYVVHKGAVALKKSPKNDIVDLCDEGDIFGLRPLVAHENYKMEATAHEESILYAVPISIFRPYAQQNLAVGTFLVESFASNTRNPYSKSHRGKLYGESTETIPNTTELKLFDLQPINYSKKPVTCSPRTSAKSIAETMTKKKVGAILVVKEHLPIGIITDKDLRNKIVTGDFPITATASKIMTAPVITYPGKLTVTQAQMAMMKNKISYLCLTEDGTTHTKIIGVLSKHDVLVALGNNPAVLIKAIHRARKTKQLKPIRNSVMKLLQGYLDQNIPIALTSKIIAELNDACVKQIIKLNLKKMGVTPPANFAWLALGSQGRSEQLLHTDQDNAIVFADVPDSKLPGTSAYFLQLAALINKDLHLIGYEYCPAEMMASNPKWCLSISEWKNVISQWIASPGGDEVLASSVFFDFNHVYGDSSLTSSLSDHIFSSIKKHPIFYVHLASGALQNPSPTGFFRQFLLEEDGAQKDRFDLKRRALRPLTEAARVLILSHEVKSVNNTSERFEKLMELEPQNEEIYLSCSYAFKALSKFRAKQGLLHNDSGRFITLDKLTKEEKVKLKRTFKTIKELQELVSVRFNVSNLLG